MRGYPQGTAWSIAPRLTMADAPAAALFSRPLASSPDTTERPQYSFVQQLPRTSKWRYTGRADGRQLQRVGLVPHLRVEPTIAGIRAGRDEVLDRALAWIGR
jgi:hypothetical protein